MDLAYMDYFQPVPGEVFEGYQELLPIDPDFWERRELWRIWGYLAAVTVEGAVYLGMLQRAVDCYL
jgi:fructosamine-3-kinase